MTNSAPSRSGALLPFASREVTRAEAAYYTRPDGQTGETLNTGQNGREDKKLIETLAQSPLFEKYQRAFGDATGLPLTLRPVEGWQLAHAGDRHQNRFCALVARHSPSCAGCLQVQQQVCSGANGVPATLRCPFGLNETAVTVKLGDRTIGYLQTGQVFFQRPTAPQAGRAVHRLQALGVTVDAKETRTAYMATPVFERHSYDSTVRLLGFFAEQLSALANQTVIQQRNAEPPVIAKAKQFIREHHAEDLSLGQVSAAVHTSIFNFCKLFKKATGITFTIYVSRVRVEMARNLLLNPNYRISEIAYHVGFQSLTHFNRSFKRITGQSPTAYRQHLKSA